MRLGLVIYGSLDTVSGGYLYDRKLVDALLRAGDNVEIISLPWRSYPRHLGDNLSAALRRRLEGLEVDLLLQDELNHPSLAWLNPRVKRRLGKPLVAIVHHLRSSEGHPPPAAWLYRQVETRYLRSLDGFVFNSQTTRRAVERLAGARRPSVVAYPAGDQFAARISDAEILVRCRQPGPLRLLFLGNLIPRKGLHYLLDALERLPGDAWRLEVVGSPAVDPGYAAGVCRQAAILEAGYEARSKARQGDGRRVTFYGSLPAAALEERLRANQVLVVPSSYEGFGIVYLEGMSFGLPAVASTAGAAGEIITPGVDGGLVPPESDPTGVERTAALLLELHHDRDLLARLSLAARRRFTRHPTWEQTGGYIRQFLLSQVKNT